MTERKRSKKSNIFVWGVMGFLVLGMGGFGLSGAFLNTGGSAVATVGNEEVSVDTFFAAFRQDTTQLSRDLGSPITLAQGQAFGVDQRTLQRLMSNAAIDNEASVLNISVGDNAVRDELFKVSAFRGPNGEFDQAAYDFALLQLNLSREEYDDVVRKSLSQILLRDGLTELSSVVSTTASDTVMTYIGELRGFDWVLIDENSLPEAASQPDQTELRLFYEANPALFTQPQTRDITYLALTPDMLAAAIDVAEADIVSEFDARDAIYNVDASVVADRITFSTQSEALAAKALIDAGTSSFEDVAVNQGLNPADISLGRVTEFQVSGAASDLLFAATEPGIFGPVDSDIGPALFRVNAVLAASSTPLSEVRDEIRDAIALDQASRQLVGSFDDINDLIAGGVSLENIASETDMQLFSMTFSPETADGLTAQQVFITEALDAELGEERDLIESEDGGIFVLRVDRINPEFLLSLDDARDTALEGHLAERNLELVLDFAATLQNLIGAGADFGATVGANGMPVNTAVDVSRNAPSDVLPVAVSEGVFDLALNELAIFDEPTGVYLVKMTNIAAFDRANPATETVLSQIQNQFNLSLEADIFVYYTGAVMDEAGFTINLPLIDAVVTQNTTGRVHVAGDVHPGGH